MKKAALSESEDIRSMALEEGEGGEGRDSDIVATQPMGMSSSSSADTIPQAVEDRIYRPPPGQWNDGLCDWYKNLIPTCYCTMFACHGVWMLAQIAKKTKFLDKYLEGITVFYLIVGVYAALLVVTIGLYAAKHVDSHHIGWVPWLWVIVIAVPLRLHVVRQQGLNGGFGIVVEGLLGFFCSPCSICQLGRHVYGYKFIFDGDGHIDKPDRYYDAMVYPGTKSISTEETTGDDSSASVSGL